MSVVDGTLRVLDVEKKQVTGTLRLSDSAEGWYADQLLLSGDRALGWSDDGLPVGVQIVAAFGREDVLVRVAAALEEAAPWADRRPQVSA